MGTRRLALTRLPTVVLPTSPLSLRVLPRPCPSATPLSISSSILGKCEADGGGLLATVPFAAPGIGVRLQLVGRAEELAHFIVTDRVRLPQAAAQDIQGEPLAEADHEIIHDLPELESSAEQIERNADESALCRTLVDLEVRSGVLPLDLGLDELGIEHAEFCRHPSWAASKVLPKDAQHLSFWLPARLPLTTELKARFLGAFSSLWRLQTAVDAIRFLKADPLHDGRYTHRFTRIVDTPATDVCGRIQFSNRPRVTIGSSASSRAAQPSKRSDDFSLDAR